MFVYVEQYKYCRICVLIARVLSSRCACAWAAISLLFFLASLALVRFLR